MRGGKTPDPTKCDATPLQLLTKGNHISTKDKLFLILPCSHLMVEKQAKLRKGTEPTEMAVQNFTRKPDSVQKEATGSVAEGGRFQMLMLTCHRTKSKSQMVTSLQLSQLQTACFPGHLLGM